MPRSRSRSEPGVFGPLEPEPLEKKYQEPEPLGKKIRSRSRLKKKSRAGVANKFAGSPALVKGRFDFLGGLISQSKFFFKLFFFVMKRTSVLKIILIS